MNSELQKNLADKQKALRDLRFGATNSKSANVKAARALRREIAQLMTKLAAK